VSNGTVTTTHTRNSALQRRMDIILGSPNCQSVAGNNCLEWSSFVTKRRVSVLLRKQKKNTKREYPECYIKRTRTQQI